jgi:DNA-binding response OmpR family regulator
LNGTPVLIVEDDMLQALDTAETLSEAGARVIGPASTISEATRLIDRTECRAVILDLQVNDGNCLDLARRLLRAGKAVIIVTGYLPENVPLSNGANCRVLSKPVSVSDLLAALEHLVTSGANERPNAAAFVAV